MDLIKFDFSRWKQGEISGFDLGDITVIGPLGVHSSSGKSPDQSMMIYLAIAHLVSGICELAQGRKRFDYVGADSSYSLSFVRKKENIVITSGHTQIGEVSARDVIHALSRGVREFLADPENRLPPTEAADEDLQTALRTLDRTLQQQR